MGPTPRRRSMRLQEKAAGETQEAEAAGAATPVASGRVVKARPSGRVVASRYLNSNSSSSGSGGGGAKPRKSEVVRKPSGSGSGWPSVRAISAAFGETAAAPKPVPRPIPQSVTRPISRPISRQSSAASSAVPRAPAGNTETPPPAVPPPAEPPLSEPQAEPVAMSIESQLLQWQLLEARAQMHFDTAKAAAQQELTRLSTELEAERQALRADRRRARLMRWFERLDRWLHENGGELEDVGRQIARVGPAYVAFARRLEATTRAMPVANVAYESVERVAEDLALFRDEVQRWFPAEEAGGLFARAAALARLRRLGDTEDELTAECRRLQASLEHSAALLASRGAPDR
ncbi:hypothetical protein LPJ53_005178 [Coemansia erecta]|uniref:Uncharacterized protein n=1 Tax=Coemansia erecta TaxID=147472 RepID=A0A9W7XVK6_9FUNG|nr:hypothetical protein LPJ53_005178 [Coemansia erecta]